MPAVLQYPNPANHNATEYRLLEDAYKAEYDARAGRFARHWKYYDGDMPQPLRIEKDGLNDNVLLAKVDQVADKTVSFLLGDGIRFDSGADDDIDASDELLEAIWQANRGQTLIHNIALSGVISGHCWTRIEPREGMPPRIVALNPAHCTAFWQADDLDRVLWYRLQYAGAEGNGKRVDYVRGRLTTDGDIDHRLPGWVEYVFIGVRGEWKIQDNPTPLLYDFPPVVDWQNLPRPHGYYGMDDVNKAVALNDAINFVASSYNRILKHHGHPKTIGLGMEPTNIVPSEIGGLWTVNKPSNEASIFNLEMQSDLGAAREFLGILTREIWQSARMVDPQTIKDTIGSLTNFGLRVIFSDVLRKTETKRQLYQEGIAEVMRRAMIMSGATAPETIAIVWPEALPVDTAQEITAGLEELAAGAIDKQTYRDQRGYDHEKIEARLQEEKAADTDLGTQLLSAFARGG